MGLSGYLVDGYGVSADDVAADRQRLDDLGGQIVLVPSSATPGPARFAPEPPLRSVGVYGEPPSAPHEVMAPAASEDRRAELAVRAGHRPGGVRHHQRLPAVARRRQVLGDRELHQVRNPEVLLDLRAGPLQPPGIRSESR